MHLLQAMTGITVMTITTPFLIKASLIPVQTQAKQINGQKAEVEAIALAKKMEDAMNPAIALPDNCESAEEEPLLHLITCTKGEKKETQGQGAAYANLTPPAL